MNFENTQIVAIDSLSGTNIGQNISNKSINSWYQGVNLIQTITNIQYNIVRNSQGPIRIPIKTIDKDNDYDIITGRLESGTITLDSQLIIQPSGETLQLISILDFYGQQMNQATAGCNVIIKIAKLQNTQIPIGNVICGDNENDNCIISNEFKANITLLSSQDIIICGGFECQLHIHSTVVDATIIQVEGKYDKQTQLMKTSQFNWLKSDQTGIVRIGIKSNIVIEKYEQIPKLGQFILRQHGKMIGNGRVIRIKQYIPGKPIQ